MANKYFGHIGFVMEEEESPGVYESKEIVRSYKGDVLQNIVGWQKSTTTTNDDVSINNRISIIADDFAIKNMGLLRWVEYMGSRWSATNIQAEYPRLIITMGGLYNG